MMKERRNEVREWDTIYLLDEEGWVEKLVKEVESVGVKLDELLDALKV